MNHSSAILSSLRVASRLPVAQARHAVRLAGLLCADKPLTGPDIFDSKVSIPSDLRTAQWARIPTWLRERAFFMASVNRAEVLDAFRETAERFTRGEIGQSEARALLREHLDRLDYKPLPGQEGTIKDLRTLDRQNVVLETNAAQVRGFASWARQQGALADFPAQRLVRFRNSKVKRNWQARWSEALRHTTSEGASDERSMIALINHPIWIALSRFGTPYAPFDFNSGMGLLPVPRSQADELGLLPDHDSSSEHKAMMVPQDRSLNETLQSDPSIRSQQIRTALAAELQGLAKWDSLGKSLLFTDPNGTRKTTVEELRDLWAGELPAGIPLYQRDALREYLRDPEEFAKHTDTDAWEDFQRLLRRLDLTDLTEIPEELWKGLAFFKGISTPTSDL